MKAHQYMITLYSIRHVLYSNDMTKKLGHIKKRIQRIDSTNTGSSMPLLYPEAMLFPSKFQYLDVQYYAFVGALPAGLLCHAHSFFGFEKPFGHIKTRTASIISNTSSNSQYVPFCWDIVVNLSVNSQDFHIVLNRRFQVANIDTGLEVYGKNNSSIHGSIDSKKMVKCVLHKIIFK